MVRLLFAKRRGGFHKFGSSPTCFPVAATHHRPWPWSNQAAEFRLWKRSLLTFLPSDADFKRWPVHSSIQHGCIYKVLPTQKPAITDSSGRCCLDVRFMASPASAAVLDSKLTLALVVVTSFAPVTNQGTEGAALGNVRTSFSDVLGQWNTYGPKENKNEHKQPTKRPSSSNQLTIHWAT